MGRIRCPPTPSPGSPSASRRACIDVCPVQCIDEHNSAISRLESEEEAGSVVIENEHTPIDDAISISSDSILYVDVEQCTSCATCNQLDVRLKGEAYSEEQLPDETAAIRYDADDPNKGHENGRASCQAWAIHSTRSAMSNSRTGRSDGVTRSERGQKRIS